MNPAFQPPPDYTRREVEAASGPSCPFYGASLVQYLTFSPNFILSGGNQCALITSAHSPCWMEVAEQGAPDWAQCPRNPEFLTEVIRGLPAAEQRFNSHVEYMDQLRVQRGIAEAQSQLTPPSSIAP